MESANIQNGNNTAEGSKQIGNGAEDICVEDNVYLAALRVTAPLASVTAVVSTVAIYVVLGEALHRPYKRQELCCSFRRIRGYCQHRYYHRSLVYGCAALSPLYLGCKR